MPEVIIMPDIVLTTANARYSHSSLALRYLLANLGPFEPRGAIMEFVIDEQPADIVEKILTAKPKIVGFSVYLWNINLLAEIVVLIKQIRPDISVVLGGPEVSFKTGGRRITDKADYIIAGEGEVIFRKLCEDLLSGQTTMDKVVTGGGYQNLDTIALPYYLYNDHDIAHRVIYLEASRGCPFGCEFCLAGLDEKVRRFPEDQLLKEIKRLFERGGRRFKFIDRALHLAITPKLLEFFLSKVEARIFVHFELVPDHLPENLFHYLRQFPKGAIQLEAGLQTFNPEVAVRINRKQNLPRAIKILKRIQAETGAHVHSDLIVGLPGETQESFASGFNQLIALNPGEIQVGLLKRLHGAPICRHDDEWKALYNPQPPYDIMENRLIPFADMQRLKRFARYFDLIYNSGNFLSFSKLLLGARNPFNSFMKFADWLYAETNKTHEIALNRLAELLFNYITEKGSVNKAEAANCLLADFTKVGRKRFPGKLQAHVTERPSKNNAPSYSNLPPRQQRHARK